MSDLTASKTSLEQKQHRLIREEIRLKVKERKLRIRHLIAMGSLLTKAGLDYLPADTLYGALLLTAKALQDDLQSYQQSTKIGQESLAAEQQQNHPVIILKFALPPDSAICQVIKGYGLKWSKLRNEWYGKVIDLEGLKDALAAISYHLEII